MVGMRRGTGLLQASPACQGASPAAPRGLEVRGAPPGAWAWFGLGLSPEPAGNKSCCLTPAGSSLFCSRAGDSAAPCSFPSPTSPGTHLCCASQKALSSQRWLPATSMFTRWSGCITCRVSPADGECGEGDVAPWAATHSCSCPLSVSVRTSVPRKHACC